MSKPVWVYLVAAARRIWGWSPEVQALRKTPRICAVCGVKEKTKATKADKFHKDHIDPIGKAPRGWDGWDDYYKRMFVPVNRLQWLCQQHHKEKTAQERKDGKYS